MHQYVIDTSFAAKGLIGLITEDAKRLDELKVKQQLAISKLAYYDMAFLHREMDVHANYWHAQLHMAFEASEGVNAEIASFEAQILDKHTSLAVLAGALLQIGKQGISSVYVDSASCKDSREIRGVQLKRVIWYGRNQTQHYEKPTDMNTTTIRTFAELNAFDTTAPQLDPQGSKNLAFEIVNLLGWTDYIQYERDMVSLLG